MDISEIKMLRAKAHVLQPALRIGKNGITEGLIKEIASQLKKKKLIKVKLLKSSLEGKQDRAIALEVATRSGATLIHHVGHIVTLYKS